MRYALRLLILRFQVIGCTIIVDSLNTRAKYITVSKYQIKALLFQSFCSLFIYRRKAFIFVKNVVHRPIFNAQYKSSDIKAVYYIVVDVYLNFCSIFVFIYSIHLDLFSFFCVLRSCKIVYCSHKTWSIDYAVNRSTVNSLMFKAYTYIHTVHTYIHTYTCTHHAHTSLLHCIQV